MKEIKNNIPNDIEEAYQQFIFEMKKFKILITNSREYISNSLMNLLNNKEAIPYLQISISALFLRQAIELLIFSNLLIDKRKYEIIAKCKNGRIEKVIQGIEEVNKNGFPKAITIAEEEGTREDLIKLKIDTNKQPKKHNGKNKESINKDDICEFYNYLSNFIHYENHLTKEKEGSNKNFVKYVLLKILDICTSLMHLTNTFIIEISSTDYLFYININNNSINGNIFAKY